MSLRMLIYCSCMILVASGLVACSPSIEIIHRDPTHKRISVIIDNNETEYLDFGDDLSVSVSGGAHLVQAIPQGDKQCPWTKNGEGWTIWVEKEAILTLLPLPAETEAGNKKASIGQPGIEPKAESLEN